MFTYTDTPCFIIHYQAQQENKRDKYIMHIFRIYYLYSVLSRKHNAQSCNLFIHIVFLSLHFLEGCSFITTSPISILKKKKKNGVFMILTDFPQKYTRTIQHYLQKCDQICGFLMIVNVLNSNQEESHSSPIFPNLFYAQGEKHSHSSTFVLGR